MKYFTTVHDIKSPIELVEEAISLKKNPLEYKQLGSNKTLGLLFMNPSFRTRLSTQKAAQNLGMNTIVLNVGQEGWALEYNDGTIMNGTSVEHIKDAAAIIGLYCDIVGIRNFAGLIDKTADYSEKILLQFMKHCSKPIISLESATLHPLQSLADCITIKEHSTLKKPKVVLTWAPHIKPLPQAVANSFCEWMLTSNVDFCITHPKGYELSEEFTKSAPVIHEQADALRDADFVYAKNWSSFQSYGQLPEVKENWMLSANKMKATNNAYLMHCLPARRNLEVPDLLLDSENSLILKQAENRIFAAQIVLKKMLESQSKN